MGHLKFARLVKILGDNGIAVNLNSSLASEGRRTFSKHAMNLVASDLVSVNRTLPDFREKK